MGTENRPCILMKMYELGRLLGKGTFAKVYHARNIRTSQNVAIKVIDKEKVRRIGLMDQIKREISIMNLIKHPNIVQLYEVMATRTKIYFVLEYIRGGELFNKISKGRLREDVSRKYFRQLIGAVDFCHSRGVFHRDLKPENLLLDDDGNLKVSDFGLSALAESVRQDGLLHTTCGTPAYVAPEVIGRRGYDGAKADIWSCGVILFVLVAGHLPFHDLNLMEMYRKIGRAEFKFPNWFPPDLRRMITRILNPDPSARISIDKIKEKQWFRSGLCAAGLTEEQEAAPEAKEEAVKPINLNAFDIISLSGGFDLTGLFEGGCRREERLTSDKPICTIISRMEEIARRLGMKVKKKDGGVLKMEASKEGRKGALAIDAEFFKVAPLIHFIEIRKANGDTVEYNDMWKKKMRPALKEIEWPSPAQPRQQLQHG